MEHTVQITLDKKYFSEAFSQSIRYGNKWRKLERILGPIFLIFGIAFLLIANRTLLSSLVLIFIGTYEILSPFIKKPFWIARLMKSKIANTDAVLTFNEEGIESKTQNSQSTITWEGVERIIETPKGVLIWPQKGMHIYVPKSLASDEAIQFIMNKYI